MTQTIPAPVAGDTKRSYLVRLGLAIEGARGRFSKDGQAALDLHPSFEWADAPKPTPKPKAPKATGATVPQVQAALNTQAPAVTNPAPSGAQANLSAKEVRAWAKSNGVKVGDRGRIHPSVIDAFQKATGKVGTAKAPQAKRPTPLDMPKVRPQNTGYVVERGTLFAFSQCGNSSCRAQISRCACKQGPTVPSFMDKGLAGKPLSLVKPAL